MFSTKGRYALRVMIDLASQDPSQPVPLKEIAERQQISKKYLEIIVRDLVSAGMIQGTSGRGGGYVLCRKPEEYTAGEILEKMEGTLVPVACLMCNAEKCDRESFCRTLPMWKEFSDITHDYFYSKTLASLLK